MNEPRQTALERMREEFQTARRRYLLKTTVTNGERPTPGPPTDARPDGAAAVLDVTAASIRCSDPP